MPGISFADVVRRNSAQQGPLQFKPLVSTDVVSKTSERLSLPKEDKKLLMNTPTSDKAGKFQVSTHSKNQNGGK